MKFKRHSRHLNEANLETRLLKAISNIPSNEIHSLDTLDEIFWIVQTMYIKLYKNTADWLSWGDCGAEEAFWAGMESSDLGPNDYKEPIIYDSHGGFVIGVKNPKFTGKLLADRLKKSGFDIEDEDEVLDFIEKYE